MYHYIGVFVTIVLILNGLQFSFEFSECGYEIDANVTGNITVNSCLEWAAYLQSNQTNVTSWCMDPMVAKACCFTCGVVYANFSQCLDASPDCQTLYGNSGRNCSSQLVSGMNIAFYCPSTCGLCNPLAGPSCSNLSSSVCGSYGHCSNATWFNVSTVTCLCANNYVGPSCSELVEGCNLTPCKNGGVCLKSGTCQCPPNYNGIYCENAFVNKTDVGLIVGISIEAFIIIILSIVIVCLCLRYHTSTKKTKVDDHASHSSNNAPLRLTRKVVETPDSSYIYFEDQNGQKYYVNPSKNTSEAIINRQSLTLNPDINKKDYYYEEDVGKFVIKRDENEVSQEYYIIEMQGLTHI